MENIFSLSKQIKNFCEDFPADCHLFFDIVFIVYSHPQSTYQPSAIITCLIFFRYNKFQVFFGEKKAYTLIIICEYLP